MLISSSRSRILLIWLLVAAAGAMAGAWTYLQERTDSERRLIADATRGAIVFRAEELELLVGSQADLHSPVYAGVKARLIRLRAIQPEARFISIIRNIRSTGTAIYLADSEPADSRNISQPGDLFPEAPQMPGFQSILRDGKPTIAGPVRAVFGNFVTAYATIGAVDGSPFASQHVLGIDIPVKIWNRHLWCVAWRSAATGWLFFGLPVAGFLWWRYRSSNETLIRKLCGAVEQSESAIMIVDLEGRIEYANAGLCSQTGFACEELVGRPWNILRKDEMSAESLADVVARAQKGLSWEEQGINRRQNGETYQARASVSPLRRHDGKPAGFVAVITDMSETVRKEEELRTAKEQAEAADHAKGRFLATMSHEVRTPLNGIVGFASLLADTPLTPEQREYVQTIRTSGQALVQLTGDILDFSRIESGSVTLDVVPCDLRANLEDAIDIFASKASDKNVQLLHWVEPDVPSQVLIDGGRLRQVLINLVGNAAKFTAAGEIEVTVRMLTGKSVSLAPFEGTARGQLVAELDDGGITLEFMVRDTGIGIAESDHAKLFRAFSQLDASTVRRFGGAGLGLAISRNLVRAMGGDIHVESERGRGSRFIFTVRARPASTKPAESQRLPYPLENQTVAVVASAAGLRAELVRLLRQAGARTIECSLEALSLGGWDLGVIDCEPRLVREFCGAPVAPGWRTDKVFGLVPVQLGTTERQGLRQHFRILLNKPAHHRTLLDLLAKSTTGNARKALGTGSPARELNVLVADDDAVQQRVAKNACETLGYDCRVVDNGLGAIAALTDGRYDLVLMDLHMPEVDGLTAIKQIRSGGAGESMRGVWVVAVTGDVRPEIMEMAFTAGANDFLTKPTYLSDLDAAVRRFLVEQKPAASSR